MLLGLLTLLLAVLPVRLTLRSATRPV